MSHHRAWYRFGKIDPEAPAAHIADTSIIQKTKQKTKKYIETISAFNEGRSLFQYSNRT